MCLRSKNFRIFFLFLLSSFCVPHAYSFNRPYSRFPEIIPDSTSIVTRYIRSTFSNFPPFVSPHSFRRFTFRSERERDRVPSSLYTPRNRRRHVNWTPAVIKLSSVAIGATGSSLQNWVKATPQKWHEHGEEKFWLLKEFGTTRVLVLNTCNYNSQCLFAETRSEKSFFEWSPWSWESKLPVNFECCRIVQCFRNFDYHGFVQQSLPGSGKAARV